MRTLNNSAAVALVAGLSAVAGPAQSYSFTQRPEITARARSAAVYDSARGRVVAVAGLAVGVNPPTLEWDGRDWEIRTSTTAGPALPQLGNSMAYDAARREVVAYSRGVTWLWDGHDWRSHSTSRPTSQVDQTMAYDPARQRVILFGGSTVAAYLNETWEWDGTQWLRRNPTVSPPARSYCDLAWDAARQVLLLHGGEDRQLRLFQDTWSWDGTVWTQLQPAASPPPDFARAMASDLTRNKIVRFALGQTWEWDGANWARVMTANAPRASQDASMTYDETTGRVMLAFGTLPYGRNYLTETWLYDGVDWSLADAREFSNILELIEDPVRGRVVALDLGFYMPWRTCEWDGVRWRVMHKANQPPLLNGAAFAFDAVTQRVLQFGGSIGPTATTAVADLWSWDGTNWTQLQPPPGPSARRLAGLGHHAASNRTVLFGGQVVGGSGVSGETWLWDGAVWQQASSAQQPSPRIWARMAYDAGRQRLVLAAGADASGNALNDTWEWDGTSWQQVPGAVLPSLTPFMSRMTYDPDSGRVVLVGYAPSSPSFGVWAFDGTAWTSAGTVPSMRALAYDSARRRLLVRTGSETWLGQIGPSVAAAAQPYGAGCAGTLGVPTLSARGMPYPGHRRFRLELASSRPNSAAAVLFSATSANVPFSGCSLLVGAGNVAFPVVTSGAGFAELPVPIPPGAMFAGATASVQAVVLDPLGAGFGLLAATAGLRLTIGD